MAAVTGKSADEEIDSFFDNLLADVGVSQSTSPGSKGADAQPAAAPPTAPVTTESTDSSAAASTSSAAPSAAAKATESPTAAAPSSTSPSTALDTVTTSSSPTAAPDVKPTSAPFDPPARTKAAGGDTESEYAQLEQLMRDHEKPASASKAAATSNATKTQTFDIGEDSDDVETVETDYAQDSRMPAIPQVPGDFTSEDRALRDVLIQFYMEFKADNIANVNKIVEKYRGRGVSNLWAQLAAKYSLPPPYVVELMTQTLYLMSPFEYEDPEEADKLEQAFLLLAKSGADGASMSQSELMHAALACGARSGSDGVLRLLSFRGIPDDCKLRPQIWKILLGYLPMARHSEWNAIQGEKRALYANYKRELLEVSDAHQVQVRKEGQRPGEVSEREELLTEIANDVDRTRRDMAYFREPTTQATLKSLLFIYAKLNPGIRYVQGMNEVAAVILFVVGAGEDPEIAEADAFWCFTELVVEIKENFIQAMDDSDEGIHALVGCVARLLRMYDPQLARHLQEAELSPFVFAFRWCTVLFAQDATLPDVVRLWDSLIADPNRFNFCVHVCLAFVLAHREELLQIDKQFTLAEVLQNAPRRSDFEKALRRSFAICAFERRAQIPPFPPRSTAMQVVDELAEYAQAATVRAQLAAARAQEVGAEVIGNFQENIAPVVMEKASQASSAAAEAAAEGAQVVQAWLEETAPARQQALDKAQTQLTSLWGKMRASAAAASATVATKGQQLAAEYGQTEALENASTTLSGFYQRASVAASAAAAAASAAAAAAADAAATPPPAEAHAAAGVQGNSKPSSAPEAASTASTQVAETGASPTFSGTSQT